MWSNPDWAAAHIRKHSVTLDETWYVAFECEEAVFIQSPDQLRYPPFIRYWTIGRTGNGRRLLVVWEQHREIVNLITAYEPSEDRVKIYERQKKKR